MKFRFATVNASKFRLPSRKNACNFSDRWKTRGRQRTETIARVVDRVGRGGWKRISIFICVGRFAIRFKPPRTLPPSSCIAIRIYRSRVNRIIGQLVKFGSARMEHRSRETYNVLRMKIIHHPPIFGEILFKPRCVIANREDFSFLLLSFAFVRWEFKAFQDR